MIRAAIDTHALLWWLGGDPRLPDSVRVRIRDWSSAGDSIAVSAITPVEILYLEEKSHVAAGATQHIRNVVTTPQGLFTLIPLDFRILPSLPLVPRDIVPDMPDRIIAAIAVSLSVPLITKDAQIQACPPVNTIW